MQNVLRGVNPVLARGIEALITTASRRGIPARITSARRSRAQQARLYRRFLAGMNAYPVAPPGHSDHEIGLAVDVWAGSPAANAELGQLWRSWGGRWSPADEVHFTVP